MTKRLFIFAAYDKDNIIDDTLLYYLQELSKLGDIVFTMDNDTPKSEMDKLSDIPNILHATAIRHNEYDFGSYKRGFIWAKDNKILNKYDWIYFVNDSVYGPLFDLESSLKDLESRDADMTGMCLSDMDAYPTHIQSWFIGLSKKLALCDFIEDFFKSVVHQDDKGQIILKYEVRMSMLVKQHGFKVDAVFTDKDVRIYESAKLVLDAGVPFVKKPVMRSLKRIELLTPYTEESFIDKIRNYATRHNVPETETKLTKYKNAFRFTVLGLPIFRIQYQQSSWGTVNYKLYLFDKIPVLKITCSK
jgi:lipopolysaccharide biosynthesis protein